MKRIVLVLAALGLLATPSAAPAYVDQGPAYMQGEESGDPCGGHEVGDWWEDASGGWWTCTSWGTDGKRASGPW